MPLLKPPRGTQLNQSHPLARGLTGCWLLNEATGDKVFDVSGHSNAGTLSGNTCWKGGKFGPALDFDGSGDYVDCGTDSSLDFTSENFTISFWVNHDTTSVKQHYFSRGKLSTNGYYLENHGDGNIYFVTNQSGNFQLTYGPSGIAAGSWCHIVIVRDEVKGKIYVNAGEINYSAQPTIVDPASSGYSAKIAAEYDGTDTLNGLIDHVRIYNRALSAAEIAWLYREPFCMFERPVSPALLYVSAGQVVTLAAALSAQSTGSAAVRLTRKVSGAANASAHLAALLKSTGRMAGVVDALAGVYGSLTFAAELQLTGTINAVSSLSAWLAPSCPGPWFAARLQTEQQWLTGALFNGMTANAFKLGTALSQGWFWMRRSGCSALYRGCSMELIDFTNVLAVAEQDATEISAPSYIPHSIDSTYFYIVRRFNNCGYQERTLAAAVKVEIDASGELAEPQPNDIFAGRAEQIDGNKIQITWFYCPLQQESKPVCFKVYYDSGTGHIDYEDPIATIGYQGRKFYSYRTDNLQGGRYSFAVRPEDAAGIQNHSLAQLRIQLGSTSPGTINILSTETL